MQIKWDYFIWKLNTTILRLYKICYGVSRGRTKGAERGMGDEQEWEKRGKKGQVRCRRGCWSVHCGQPCTWPSESVLASSQTQFLVIFFVQIFPLCRGKEPTSKVTSLPASRRMRGPGAVCCRLRNWKQDSREGQVSVRRVKGVFLEQWTTETG